MRRLQAEMVAQVLARCEQEWHRVLARGLQQSQVMPRGVVEEMTLLLEVEDWILVWVLGLQLGWLLWVPAL